jgi:ubiquinone/menaquinone biosynthesis C-methylase UbiE
MRPKEGHAKELPYEDNSFDLAVSINTLHNLYCIDLDNALKEMQRVREKISISVLSHTSMRKKRSIFYTGK